ncbi:MAG: 30S ribosomal protein S17e [Candidatus Diapherotrites archaeon]|nr:30S ribosomal protein S17e [Candidatus Diapherotrites archaeon]
MGKAVPKAIKMRVETLLQEIPEKFSTDFEKNKEALNSLNLPFSVFDRNMMAAFLTRKVKASKKM